MVSLTLQASTLNLRVVASTLSRDPRFGGATVHAISARWSDRVDAGKPAEVRIDCLRRLGRSVVIAPFFIGPSATVTDFAPRQVRVAMDEHPGLTVKIAPPLHCPCPHLDRLQPPARRRLGADNRIARAVLARQVARVREVAGVRAAARAAL